MATIPASIAAPASIHVAGDPFAAFGTECAEQLHVSPFNEFVVNDSETSVMVLEVTGSPAADQAVQQTAFYNTQSLVTHCRANLKPRLRVISIPQDDSYSELEITKSCMEQLLDMHDVSVDFLHVLRAAGNPPLDSEEGFGQAIENVSEDGSFSLAYLSRYYGQREESWKLRQTGVYHAYSASTQSNLFILLHPGKETVFEQALIRFSEQAGSAAALVAQPTRLHAMLFSAYFDNWRAFLKDKGDSFITGATRLFVANIDGEEYVDISFKRLQSWRDLEDRVMPLTSMFQVLLDLLDTLEGVDQRFAERARTGASTASTTSPAVEVKTDFFRSRKGSVKALMASATGLQKRIHGVLDLLANTLEMRNHKQLTETNKLLVNLQIENVEDNATVQIITVVTLMYLPASFVASLFGMNLFVFNPDTAHIRIAKDFWLYVAVMVPLTFVTVFWWYVRTRKSKAERERKRTPPAQQIAQNLISTNLFQTRHIGLDMKSRAATWV